MTRNALLSVYDKTGLEDFAKQLIMLGFTLYGSKGTCEYLARYNTPAIDVSTIVGGGPIFGHRIVTLSRRLFACLLYRKGKWFSKEEIQEDSDELKSMGLIKFDLVYVDLYPFEKAAADPDLTHQQIIEKIDIGGRALLTAAAKNGLITLCDKSDWAPAIRWLREGMPNEEIILREQAAKIEACMAIYSLAIAKYLINNDGRVTGQVNCKL
jgi:phosphoribosylaminoimidazolecarboxamide formyltransferase / IMP cyclohydrolase